MSIGEWAWLWAMFITLATCIIVSYLALKAHIERVAFRSKHGCFDHWPPLPEPWPDPPAEDESRLYHEEPCPKCRALMSHGEP